MKHGISWDIFCRVIDNFGDIGVCWRLAADLAARGCAVRLWVDDGSALRWMAPGALDGLWPNVRVHQWKAGGECHDLAALPRHDILVEGFGCEAPPQFLIHHWSDRPPGVPTTMPLRRWINLEYLSAEDFVQKSHGLPSPVMHGPARGKTRHFFFPGLSRLTGGLLREPGLQARQNAFHAPHWLAARTLPTGPVRRISLFCYEPAALALLLGQLQAGPDPTELLVTAGRAMAAVQRVLGIAHTDPAPSHRFGALRLHFLPHLSQLDYDHLLWSCDLNFVRGEDSLVRAVWAGKPLVWQIYPQEDNSHHPKLLAMLDALSAPTSCRQFHLAWNGMQSGLPPCIETPWQDAARAACRALESQIDLASRLLEFVTAPPAASNTTPENR